MSSERTGGQHVFNCDTCTNVLETRIGDFTAALAMAKEDGWIAYKVGSEWCHSCDSCKRRG